MITVTHADSTPAPPFASEPSAGQKSDKYSVAFDENEAFPDEISQSAAQHIDPCIKQAVQLINTVSEDKLHYSAVSCDYKYRPKARDTITYPHPISANRQKIW